ncbi:MAG: hypothetical protein ACLUDD_04805 [Lactobacillus kalixensis]|uniref:hypothetical protein n=1 Tax=Lactobacillus kalixensis TaxID=227944 RepID=UPI003995D04E
MNKLHQTIKHLWLNHPQHALLGLTMIGVGTILLVNRYYFFWPPFAVHILNDDLVGGTFIAVGIGLICWSVSNKNRISTNRNLLVASAVLLAAESTAEFCHAFISGRPHMVMAGFLELIILLFDFLVISNSKKHNY